MRLTDVFPEILRLGIDVFVTESGLGPEQARGSFTLDSLPETVPCTNPRCRRGGLSLRFQLDEMVTRRQSHGGFSKVCGSDEGSPQGRVRGKKCLNSFRARHSHQLQE
jgi:hypothetical protein